MLSWGMVYLMVFCISSWVDNVDKLLPAVFFFFRWQQIEAKMSRQTPVDLLFVFHDAIGSNLGDAKAKKKRWFWSPDF